MSANFEENTWFRQLRSLAEPFPVRAADIEVGDIFKVTSQREFTLPLSRYEIYEIKSGYVAKSLTGFKWKFLARFEIGVEIFGFNGHTSINGLTSNPEFTIWLRNTDEGDHTIYKDQILGFIAWEPVENPE